MLKRHELVKTIKKLIDLLQKNAAYTIHERSSNPYGFSPLAAEYTFGDYNLRLYQVVADADSAAFAVVFGRHDDEIVFVTTHIWLISKHKVDLGALPFCFGHMEAHQLPRCPKTSAQIFHISLNKFEEVIQNHLKQFAGTL
jgi:hypothetical protein